MAFAGADLGLVGAGFAQEKLFLFVQDSDGTIIPKCWALRSTSEMAGPELGVLFDGREFNSQPSAQKIGDSPLATQRLHHSQ